MIPVHYPLPPPAGGTRRRSSHRLGAATPGGNCDHRRRAAPIVGARRPSRIEETVIVGEWALADEDIAAEDCELDLDHEYR